MEVPFLVKKTTNLQNMIGLRDAVDVDFRNVNLSFFITTPNVEC
jgi:hypothetical protein